MDLCASSAFSMKAHRMSSTENVFIVNLPHALFDLLDGNRHAGERQEDLASQRELLGAPAAPGRLFSRTGPVAVDAAGLAGRGTRPARPTTIRWRRSPRPSPPPRPFRLTYRSRCARPA